MGVKIVQSCDRCGKSEEYSTSTPERQRTELRRVAVDYQYGPARDEQPILCRDCCRAVMHFIKCGSGIHTGTYRGAES